MEPKKLTDESVKLVNDLKDISFVEIALIIAGTWVAIWLSKKILPYLAEQGPSKLRLYVLGAVPIIRLVLLVACIMWVIPIIFNITFQNFLVIAGAASVAIGFAFKDYVSSLIAGVVAIIERPYRPGDWVEIDGDYGEVVAVGMRAISVLTPSDDMITIPHDKIWNKNISNSNNGANTLMCVAHFYLAPDHEAASVKRILFDVALTSAYTAYHKPVNVVLKETLWGTHYQLKAYPFDMRHQFDFVSDLTIRGKQAIHQVGGVESTSLAAAESA